MRDWYRGPCERNHVSTSVSTRSEIASFSIAGTSCAFTQKSGGRFLSSGGDVRSISASVTRRRRERSARPTATLVDLGIRLVICLSLTACTHSGRDDATLRHAVICESICKYDEGKIETTFREIPRALMWIPREANYRNVHVYIHSRKGLA